MQKKKKLCTKNKKLFVVVEKKYLLESVNNTHKTRFIVGAKNKQKNKWFNVGAKKKNLLGSA